MKIEDAINQLIEAKNQGTKSIVLAYWEADMFGRRDDDSWEWDSEQIEENMDWSHAHDQMTDYLESLQ